MRILAIDYGTKHTGLALGVDTATTPLASISTRKFDYLIQEIIRVVDSEHIDKIIVGNPINKDSKQSKITEIFVEKLKQKIECEVVMVNEYKSSTESFSQNFEKHSKIKKLKQREHSLAAEQILKNYYLGGNI